MAEAGAIGFKCFLCESGVDEFKFVREAELHPAMRELARIRSQLLVHAEMPGPLDRAEAERWLEDPRRLKPAAGGREAAGPPGRLSA